MRSLKDDQKQRSNTAIEDKSTCLVSNLSQFRSPTCHHFDLTSMGMHPEFCKLRVLSVNLKTPPTWNPCLVRGTFSSAYRLFCRQEQSWRLSQACIVEGSNVYRSNVLATRAKFCRQEPCCGGKNNPGGCPCRQGQDVID